MQLVIIIDKIIIIINFRYSFIIFLFFILLFYYFFLIKIHIFIFHFINYFLQLFIIIIIIIIKYLKLLDDRNVTAPLAGIFKNFILKLSNFLTESHFLIKKYYYYLINFIFLKKFDTFNYYCNYLQL